MGLKIKYFLFLICGLTGFINAADGLKPVARFSFNGMKDYDEVSHEKAKLVGINYTADRFGNDNNAVFLSGNASSYINLGTYAALKQKTGSISLWVNIEHAMPSGTGALYNPIIMTKYTNLSDFYESYAVYYMLETKKIVALAVEDSTREVQAYSKKTFERNEWQHITITYDYSYLCLYINGKLEDKIVKKFETAFLASDSVVIGVTASKKNNRWLSGAVDDIEFYDVALTAGEVKDLYNAPNPNKIKIVVNKLLVALLIIVVIILLYFLVRYQATLKLKKEKEQLQLANKLLETELRVNRALMNPHFVFNSLNALQHFILQREIPKANNYLIKFSKLIRRILESNMSNITSLEMEIELINRYLEIEDLRFEENIQYSIEPHPDLILSNIHIPVMMIQPFVENAIWHGLLKKPGKKIIKISFTPLEGKCVLCVIEDNGIGRQATEQSDIVKRSLATTFVLQRLNLLNKLYNLSCSLVIEDKPNGQGTIVKIQLPILNK